MFAPHQTSDADKLTLRCLYCSTETRLRSFSEVQKGDHIKIAGELGLFNFGKKQINFYCHHAIIKEVQPLDEDGSSAILTLLQFMSTPFDSGIKIRETVEVKHLYNDEIYVIKHRHQTYSPEEIIRRGEKLTQENIKYHGLYCNCEHLANWCVCGREESLQAQGLFERLRDYLKTAVSFVGRVFGLTIDDMFVFQHSPFVGDILMTLMILGVLVNSITHHKLLDELFQQGSICETCCKRKKRDIWLKFAVLLIVQTGGIILTKSSSFLSIDVLVSVLANLLTVLLMKYIPNFFRNVYSPFVGRKVKLTSFHTLSVGDVVSWRYMGLNHDGIVSDLRATHGTHGEWATLKVVHYALQGIIFARRKIVEESMTIDLKRDKFRRHDYTGYDVNEPDIVVERARKRIGETKYGLTNRSANFCHWAKLKDTHDNDMSTAGQPSGILTYLRPLDPESDDYRLKAVYIDHRRERPFASKEINREYAKIRDDIKPGQLIQFIHNYLPHHGVCTEVRPGCKPSVVIVLLVHYGESKIVCEEAFTFDLHKENITIVNVHPINRYGPNDVVRKARAKIGENRYHVLFHRSAHLTEEIVYKEKHRRIFSFSEVKPGDCIKYNYWWLPHDAVVVALKPDQTKANDTGYITVVHYALDSVIGTRYIKEEIVYFNLSKNIVKLKTFPKTVVYPSQVVVQRARSRVGEKKFHIKGNISSDVVHWAKVVQEPCVVTVTPTEQKGANTQDRELQCYTEYLLVPKVGTSFDNRFQETWVKTWDEIIPGYIVEYKAIRGIVSEVNKKDNMVKAIQNKIDTDKRDTRVGNIREVNIKADIRKRYLNLYRCEPSFANKPSVCLQNAKSRLGQTVVGVSEWEFCKMCVLRNYV